MTGQHCIEFRLRTFRVNETVKKSSGEQARLAALRAVQT